MNKRLLISIIAIIVVIVIAIAYAVTTKPKDSETASTTETTVTNKEDIIAKEDVAVISESQSTTKGAYVDYSDTAIVNTKGTKLLFFHAPWCSQCRSIEKSINSGGLPDGVTVIKVDYDTHQDLRKKYGVTLQTTFVKVDDTGSKIASYVAYEEPTFSSVERELLN